MVKLGKLKQVREAMKAKKSLSQEVAIGQVMDGQVQVSIDGTQKVTAVHIDESLLNPDSKEKLEKAIMGAHSDALKKLQKVMVEKMRSGELQLPDMPS